MAVVNHVAILGLWVVCLVRGEALWMAQLWWRQWDRWWGLAFMVLGTVRDAVSPVVARGDLRPEVPWLGRRWLLPQRGVDVVGVVSLVVRIGCRLGGWWWFWYYERPWIREARRGEE